MTRRILLADDDRVLSDLLAQYFSREGFLVSQVFDGEEAVVVAAEGFDVIVVDVMMPRMDGLETLRALRRAEHAARDTPIIMLTAKGEEVDRIVGLEMGADDYLPKPCNPRELLARVKAVLRRAERSALNDNVAAQTMMVAGALRLDSGNREARAHEVKIALTDSEFSVLEALLRRRGKLFGKDELSQQALGKKLGRYDRSLDMHISHLRKKLNQARCGININTVRGRGFILSVADDETNN